MTDKLTRQEISDAVGPHGWRYILGTVRTVVPTGSLATSAQVVATVVARCGPDAEGHLQARVRADHALFTLQSLDRAEITALDLALAARISAAVAELGLRTDPGLDGSGGSTQLIEIAIDALDIPAIRPFWRAVLGYEAEPGREGPCDALVDPGREAPALWFQQMDAARPQRNRIHLDISVPHEAAAGRIAAALAAGGVLVSDRSAPAFWVLADVEGNEVCVTTWQGRD
jgi:4a-hydroxytetrahydrobiopterin dehydratase